DPNGIWAQYNWRDVATPEGFERNPRLVHEFYNMRRRAHSTVRPNLAHLALAKLEARHPAVTIVTQNVDALHEAAGARNLIHMHGEVLRVFCVACDARHVWTDDLSSDTDCPSCLKTGGMRPDVVWFGETPYHMDRIAHQLATCDLFISIGTSGNVYPAAGFVALARGAGAHTVELNLEPSSGATLFNEAIYGAATDIVPTYVDKLLHATSA
ncbi:MAG TPA: NAD-dependent deacylase, partial [Hyphomicrobium sp.]|nr:NAD-dependent deacylase [Hyphomicrobium sp.]